MRARDCWRAFLVLCVLAASAYAQTSHIEIATQLLSNGETAQAEVEARKALQNPSTRALALAMLGTIRLQQGKTEESTKFLDGLHNCSARKKSRASGDGQPKAAVPSKSVLSHHVFSTRPCVASINNLDFLCLVLPKPLSIG